MNEEVAYLHRLLSEEFKNGRIGGQKEMRERAALVCEKLGLSETANKIRALPVEE